MSTLNQQIIEQFAPTGMLRASINYGNLVLAQRDPASGELSGVSVVLAHELAKRLGVPVELHAFETAGKAFHALSAGDCDVGFLAIDPVRGAEIDYTNPYVLIEGGYLVRAGSHFAHVDELDREGVRITAGRNTAYDLYLQRELKHAQLVYAATSAEAITLFLEGEGDAAAGIKAPLAEIAATRSDVRLTDGRFMQIEQAMAMPKGRDLALAWLRGFVEEVKASGLIRTALTESGQADAKVAPAMPA